MQRPPPSPMTLFLAGSCTTAPYSEWRLLRADGATNSLDLTVRVSDLTMKTEAAPIYMQNPAGGWRRPRQSALDPAAVGAGHPVPVWQRPRAFPPVCRASWLQHWPIRPAGAGPAGGLPASAAAAGTTRSFRSGVSASSFELVTSPTLAARPSAASPAGRPAAATSLPPRLGSLPDLDQEAGALAGPPLQGAP